MKLLHRLTDTMLLVMVTPTAANSRLSDYQIIQIIQLVILIVWLQTLPAFTQKHTGHGPRELGATTYSSSLVTPQHHGTLPSILISVAVPLNHHFSGYAKLFMLHQSFKKIGNVFRVVWWHNGWVEDMNDNLFWLYNLQQPWIVQKPKITSPPSCTSSVSKLKYCKFHRIMLDTKLCGASCNAIFQMKSKLLKLLFSLQIFHTDNQIIIFHMEVNQINF